MGQKHDTSGCFEQQHRKHAIGEIIFRSPEWDRASGWVSGSLGRKRLSPV